MRKDYVILFLIFAVQTKPFKNDFEITNNIIKSVAGRRHYGIQRHKVGDVFASMGLLLG